MQMQSLAKQESSEIHAVGQQNMYSKRGSGSEGASLKNPVDDRSRRCYNCNRFGHFARDVNCPEKNQNCNLCGLKGHFSVCCGKRGSSKPNANNNAKGKKAYHVSGETSYGSGDGYAFVVGQQCQDGEVTLTIGGVKLKGVLIDSGASCNLIDYETWDNLKRNSVKCDSKQSDKKLFAYGQKEPIQVAGTFASEIVCEINGKKCVDEFTVFKGTGRPLLGRNTAEKLKVLRVGHVSGVHVSSVMTEGSDTDIRKGYADILTGVGKLKDYQFKLHLNKDVKPVAQPVRRLPFGLREKVDKKLDELLSKDIIEEVPPNTPTEWVSPLVVVSKPDEDIRVCVDMRRANEAIIRERHPIPTIEEMLYDLNGAIVFSKLDLKWGFHQIELEEQSRDVTTFVTHRGLYIDTRG